MKRSLLWLLPLTAALAAASCTDDDPKNRVPDPGEAGAAGDDGGGRGGSSGAPVATGGGGAAGAPTQPEGGAAGEVAEGGAAGADPGTVDSTCASLPGTIVYIESGDTQESLLKALGRHLRDTADITLVFNLTGSCTLTADMYAYQTSGTKVVKNGMLKYIPSTAENKDWTTAMPESTCTTPAAGVPIDVAISALFVDSCGLQAPPAGLALIQGPIQAYTFIVPTASTQKAIWAQEAYYAFGFGAANPLAPAQNPWNDELFLFTRPPTKSTLVATAKNINLPPNKWKGQPQMASGDVVTSVTNSTKPQATLGILGAEVYDNNRNKGMQTLAFQAFKQKAAYYPDSTATSFDKQNLRDGHYTLWSPTVYITPVDGDQVPTNPAVKYLVDLVLGGSSATPPNGGTTFDSLADVVKVGLIPDCAMKVSRTTDGGDLSPFTPPESCSCYYASKVPGATGAPAGCTACTTSATCGGGTCSHGYCEPDAVSAVGTPGPDCFSGTATTHEQLINACTTAQSIVKAVTLPADDPEPLP